MDGEEIGGFVTIHRTAYPVMKLPKDKLQWFRETYKGIKGIPKAIYVESDTDKFYLFPHPTNDWQLRYFNSNNRQIHTSCFKSEK